MIDDELFQHHSSTLNLPSCSEEQASSR
jgi:hypothetical protein